MDWCLKCFVNNVSQIFGESIVVNLNLQVREFIIFYLNLPESILQGISVWQNGQYHLSELVDQLRILILLFSKFLPLWQASRILNNEAQFAVVVGPTESK